MRPVPRGGALDGAPPGPGPGSKASLRTRTPVLAAALVAAAVGSTIAALGPPGGDTAAHLYRIELVERGVLLWDNHWFGGHYPLASYSLVYYLPAALVGNAPLVVAAAAASAALFASIAVREWGTAARWPALAFGLVAAQPVYTGTYSYGVGLTASLACLRLLQEGRQGLAAAAGALALGFSPLAFAFLCLVLAALALAYRRVALPLAAGLAGAAALQLAALALFPTAGRYPFSTQSLLGVLAVSVPGAALALGAARGGGAVARRPALEALALVFALWAVGCALAFVVPSPFGGNLARLREIGFPLVLLVAVLARFRPRPVAAVALVAALVYNVVPDLLALPKRTEDARTATAAFWAPALAFLDVHATPEHRVEVVPTFGHWEAYWIPRSGFALARGWYRQLDIAQNPELYREPLTAAAYRRWLRRLGVRFVLLPDARLGPLGAEREAALLASGAAGLERVHETADWTVFELPGATPILTGSGTASIRALDHERIAGRVGGAGAHRLRVRFTPYWKTPAGICVEPRADGDTRLVARRPGDFVLTLRERPAAVLAAAFARPAC